MTDARTGAPIRAVVIVITRQGQLSGVAAVTDAFGHYRKDGLVPGAYTLRTTGENNYLNELHDNRRCHAPVLCDPSRGDLVDVRGDETTVIDFALDLGGSFSGLVVDEFSGKLATQVFVRAWNSNGMAAGLAATDDSGRYTLERLVPGTYFATISSPRALYVEELWLNVACPTGPPSGCDPTAGNAIAVSLASETPGIDFSLTRRGVITGTVTSRETGLPVSRVSVNVWDASGTKVQITQTDADGRYSTHGLDSGTYFVTASARGLSQELYDAFPCPAESDGCAPTRGTPVPLMLGQIAQGIDLSLQLVTGLSGVVRDEATGVPLRDVGLGIWEYVTSLRPRWQTTTNAEGRYSIGLSPGTFRVATDNRRGATDEIYDDAPCPDGPAIDGLCDVATGTPVTLSLNQVDDGIDFDLAGATCLESDSAACLNQGRFRVEVAWRTRSGASGSGQARELSADSGYFWFFNEANVELVVKILDGCFAPFNSFWVFAAGLTDIEVEITVTDTVTRAVKTYTNPLGTPFRPILDTGAFATCNAKSQRSSAARPAPRRSGGRALPAVRTPGRLAAKSATCFGSETDLCLNDDRFRIEVFWTTPAGATGRGRAVELTSDTGYYWFFDAGNVEAVVKVLDACELEGFHNFWVFAAGLTNVDVALRVTDTVSRNVREYHNPGGTPFRPILDTAAFATCP